MVNARLTAYLAYAGSFDGGKSVGALIRHGRRLRLFGRQPVCKPGSVGPTIAGRRDGHSSGTSVAEGLAQPTRTADLDRPGLPPRRSYSVLLPVGFTMPRLLPGTRWALTPPFHPYPDASGRFAFCGTFPGVAPAGCYPAPFVHGARTFLHRDLSIPAAATVRPTGPPHLGAGGLKVKR